MTPINLTKIASKFKSGWVAVNKDNHKFIAHAKDFASIMKKVETNKNALVFPASRNYYGFVTFSS